eukprot:scaffold287165_cov36-Tisochrysis_lutea.AAC.5
MAGGAVEQTHRWDIRCTCESVAHAARLGRSFPHCCSVAINTRLNEVRGDVLKVGAHHVSNVDRCEAAREVKQCHIEVDLDFLVGRLVQAH